jgi:hypothetical protein
MDTPVTTLIKDLLSKFSNQSLCDGDAVRDGLLDLLLLVEAEPATPDTPEQLYAQTYEEVLCP